jgi:hypothetical protein
MQQFVGFSRIFLLEILIFKGLPARRLYKSFGIKGLIANIEKGVDSDQCSEGVCCDHFYISACNPIRKHTEVFYVVTKGYAPSFP